MSRKIEQTIKAFREARVAGERLLEEGRISYEQFYDVMRLYEDNLRDLGVDL